MIKSALGVIIAFKIMGYTDMSMVKILLLILAYGLFHLWKDAPVFRGDIK